MPLEIIRNDITKVRADAIVNTANPDVAVGAGVDSAIYKAAGWDALLAERAKIGPMAPGQAAATPAFELPAKHIIHTVGPAWIDGTHGELRTLAACYRNSLALAARLGCSSVAFPLISTGTYGFPKDRALRTAVSEITGFLFSGAVADSISNSAVADSASNGAVADLSAQQPGSPATTPAQQPGSPATSTDPADMTVYLVVYDKEAFEVSGKAFTDIRSYIGDADVRQPLDSMRSEELARQYDRRLRMQQMQELERRSNTPAAPAGSNTPDAPAGSNAPAAPAAGSNMPAAPAPLARRKPGLFPSFTRRSKRDSIAPSTIDSLAPSSIAPSTIDDALKTRDDTFQEYLFRLIDRKGLTDPEVYKLANLDRKHFSKIRSNRFYNPSKRTALALAIALRLNLDETRDLLLKAGLALTRSSDFDIIIEYCIQHRVFDINEINCILFSYDQPTLGA